jgi:hypothetical protein
MTYAVGVVAGRIRAFSPPAARKNLSFSFDFAASPQNQTNLNGKYQPAGGKKERFCP